MATKKRKKKKSQTIKKTLNLKINLETQQRPARRKRIVNRRRRNLREMRRGMGGFSASNLQNPTFFGNVAQLSNSAMSAMNNRTYAIERELLNSRAELNAKLRAGNQNTRALERAVNTLEAELQQARQQFRQPRQAGVSDRGYEFMGEQGQRINELEQALQQQRQRTQDYRQEADQYKFRLQGTQALLRSIQQTSGATLYPTPQNESQFAQEPEPETAGTPAQSTAQTARFRPIQPQSTVLGVGASAQ